MEHNISEEREGDKGRLICSCGRMTVWMTRGDSDVSVDVILGWTRDHWEHGPPPDVPPWAV